MHIVRGRKYFFGVPQGSIPGSIFFNIFLTDLFLLISDTNFSSYAEDNNIYIYIILVIALMMLSHLYKNQQKNFFDGSLITKLKKIQINAI